MADEDRSLTPDFVYDQWRRAERRRKDQRKRMERAKNAYESRLWKSEGRDEDSDQGGEIAVEVSRLPGIIQAYTGFLFLRSPRAIVSPDVEGQGDPTKAELVINRWFMLRRIHTKLSRCVGQSLLYRGSAIKLGLDLTRLRPQDRVWERTIPWWDLILDHDTLDEDDARFIGHEYWEDVAVLERRLGIDIPDDAIVTKKDDYLSARQPENTRSLPDGEDKNNDRRWVRVLEWYNLIDDWESETGKTRGVFQLYLVEQLRKDKRRPLIEGAMPFQDPDGMPCVPIIPLIFDHEMEKPFAGIAMADRVYDQCKEIALLRSAQANAVRRDARVLFVNKNAGMTEADLAQWVQGKDGSIVFVDMDKAQSWDKAFFIPKFGSLSQNYQTYEMAIEADLNQGANVPRFARGEAMGSRTTATEVRQLNQYMENRFGELARIKDAWVAEISRVLLRVMVMAMKAPALLLNSDKATDDPEAKKPDVLTYQEGTKRVSVQVSVKDLEAEFDIGIADSASTPLTKELRKQDLVLLGDRLMGLWDQARQGNPMATALLKSMVDLFDLPADFAPETLASKTQDQMQAAIADPRAMMASLAKIPDEFWEKILPQPGNGGGAPALPAGLPPGLAGTVSPGQPPPMPGA